MILIQKFWRGHSQCRKYRTAAHAVKKVVAVVRGFLARRRAAALKVELAIMDGNNDSAMGGGGRLDNREEVSKNILALLL